MIIPEKLNKGDRVLVVPVSGSLSEKDKEYIEKSKKMLEDVGLIVDFSEHAYSKTTGYGASIKEKIEDIHNGFKNPKYKMIFCAKGGGDSNALFDYLDYELIKENPKIVCGFSDATSFTNMITEKTGLVTFSGATFKSLSSWETDYAYKECIKRFMNEDDLSLGTEADEYVTIREGKAIGELIGGNLSLTAKMAVGKHSINFKNKILFIEELGFESEPAICAGNLYFMKQNGVFDKIRGIWIGNYEHEDNVDLERIVLDVVAEEYDFPIIKSNNFGHTDKKTVIPIGTIAKIDTSKKDKIELIEKCVK